ncbi:MAG: helix-turn-helix transcriptional regulator, partial [Thermocrispum sp.]
RRIEFVRPGAGQHGVYRRLFGDDVTFGGRRNAVVTGTDTLTRPMRQANAVLTGRFERQCLELIDRRLARGGVAGQVRGLLRVAEGAPPDVASVARELFTGERTLRRQLAAEGTSFRALVAEHRMARAERLLAGTELTVAQVASELGYSEAAAFVRAFGRLRGRTPAAYRDSVRSTTTGAWSDGASPLRASRST